MAANNCAQNIHYYSAVCSRKTSAEIIRAAKEELSKKHHNQESDSFGMIITPIGSRPVSSKSSQLSFSSESPRPTSGVILKPLRHRPSSQAKFDEELKLKPSPTNSYSVLPKTKAILPSIKQMEPPSETFKNAGKRKIFEPSLDDKASSSVRSNETGDSLFSLDSTHWTSPSKISTKAVKGTTFEPQKGNTPFLQPRTVENVGLAPADLQASLTKVLKSTSKTKKSALSSNRIPSPIITLTNVLSPVSALQTTPAKGSKIIGKVNNLELTSTKTPLQRRKTVANVSFIPVKLSVRPPPAKTYGNCNKMRDNPVGDVLERCLSSRGEVENKKEENDVKTKQFNKKVLKMLPVLEGMVTAKKYLNENTAIQTVQQFHQLFENYGMFENNFESRFRLLKVLFKLLNAQYPILCLEIIQLVLQIKVADANLENICKLLLKLCIKDKSNIPEILSSGAMKPFIESMQNIDIQNDLQTVEYFSILMYTLSSMGKLIDVLGTSNCQYPLLHHIIGLNSLESSEIHKKHVHIVRKIISSLQNLSNSELVWKTVLSREFLEQFLKTARVYQSFPEVISVIIGFLSEIVSKEDGCEAFVLCENICFIFTELLGSQKLLPSIIIQIISIIGNLMIEDKDLASGFFLTSGFKDLVFSILNFCVEKQVERARRKKVFCRNPNYSSSDNEISISDIELMTNSARILANMCLDPQTGRSLADNAICIISLMQVINLYKIEHTGFVPSLDEPLSCAHIALRNITYFINDESQTLQLFGEITNALLPFLNKVYPLTIRAETCKMIQNLTRTHAARLHVLQNNLLPIFVDLLNERENEVALGGYGIFMNLLVEEQARIIFDLNKGVSRLRNKLQMSLYRDWKVSTLLCKVLWNYCFYKGTSDEALAPPEVQRILKILRASTDSSILLNMSDKATQDIWEMEFLPTGKNLLKLLEPYAV